MTCTFERALNSYSGSSPLAHLGERPERGAAVRVVRSGQGKRLDAVGRPQHSVLGPVEEPVGSASDQFLIVNDQDRSHRLSLRCSHPRQGGSPCSR